MFVHECLVRHLLGDWGNLCEGDRNENEKALVNGSRLFSAYKTNTQPKIWIITEADRSSTCILFPDEY
jgi:acetyl-CoA carboxylase carboxyltransferase component